VGNESTVNEQAEMLSFRNVGLWFGIAYLILPTLSLNSYFLPLPQAALDVLFRFMISCITPIGILCLGFLAASVWNPEGRDWPSVDRAFGIFLGITAVSTILSLVFSWGVADEFYIQSTRRLIRGLLILNILLMLCGAAFFYKRPSWAALPVGFAVLVTLAGRIEPDDPAFVQEQKLNAEKAQFYQAVDDSFWASYWDTKTAEEVRVLFATLPGEVHGALSSVLREDNAQALLERGDDSAFLEVFWTGVKRGEDGSFNNEGFAVAIREIKIGHAGFYPYVIALSYALLRGVMAFRWLRAVEAPA